MSSMTKFCNKNCDKISVIVNKERSLCANLAACLKYPTEHVIA